MDTVMRFLPRALRERTLSYSASDLGLVALIAVVVSVWAAVAGGEFSLAVFVACQALFFSFYLVGSLFAGWRALSRGVRFDLPLRLLVGYAVVNTALLVLCLISPFGMVANFAVLLGIALLAFFSARQHLRSRRSFAGYFAIGLSLVATTLWCQDSIRPVSTQGDIVVYKPWIDSFYHAIHIRIFAGSHGAWTLEDFRMAGVPARPYHYGIYLMPAFIKAFSGLHSYTAFAGILAPLGVFFTGLASYCFLASFWGAWAGVAAAAALLLLPDGAQQGLGSPFMSYHWLTQISPSATYGLALLALAWLFVIKGCLRGSRLQLGVGWFIAAVLVAYKLHYVIASALLLLLVPALFFRSRIALRWRMLWVACACALYGVALAIAQKVPGVPPIRFDGSAVGEILRLVQTFAKPSEIKEFVASRTGPQLAWTSNLLWGIPFVLIASLGVSLLLFSALAVRMLRRTPLLYVLFPLLLIVNFLAMFFGLALDFESSTPDELSHRPLMVVYFFVVSWIGGALGLCVLKWQPTRGVARRVIVGVATLLLVVPASFGPGVQLLWAMPKISPVRIPTALVQVAEHIRTHGAEDDVFQDSQYDRTYTIGALSERRAFGAHALTRMPFRAEMLAKRTSAADRLMLMRDSKLVVGTARSYGLRWFVIHAGNRINWPPELADAPAVQARGVRLYEF